MVSAYPVSFLSTSIGLSDTGFVLGLLRCILAFGLGLPGLILVGVSFRLALLGFILAGTVLSLSLLS